MLSPLTDFPWSKKLHELKKSVFGVDEFRALQEQTMNATLSGQDGILVMPTGGGKSLCYQLPALVDKGKVLLLYYKDHDRETDGTAILIRRV